MSKEKEKFITTVFQDEADEPGCLSVIIPEEILKSLNLKVGDKVDVHFDNNKKVIIVTPVNR